MAARNTEDLEKLRLEQGQQFLKQMSDMFTATRVDLAAQFVPRSEWVHTNESIERVTRLVETLTKNLGEFREQVPRNFADRTETKQDIAEMRADLDKLKALYDADLRRGYDYRFEDVQGRYKGDMRTDQAWRANAQAQGVQLNVWLVGALFLVISTAIPIILTLALRPH